MTKLLIFSCLSLTFLLSKCVPRVTGQNYSYNIGLLEKLAYIDLQVVRLLTAELEHKNLEDDGDDMIITSDMSNYIQDFHDGCGKVVSSWTKKDAKKVAENPICAYRLLRRFMGTLPTLLPDAVTLFESEENLIPKEVIDFWPSVDDLNGAMEGIFRMQQIDNIPAAELARGKILDTETGASLTLTNCAELAEHALEKNEYNLAIEWAQAAKDRPNIRPLMQWTTVNSVKAVQEFLETAIVKHDEAFEKAEETDLHFFDRPIKSNFTSNTNYSKSERIDGAPTMRRETLVNKSMENLSESYLHFRHLAMCRGHRFQTTATKSPLFCWLEFKQHPSFFIGPTKMELVSRDPDVLIVHQLLGKKFMHKVKRKTVNQFTTQTLAAGTTNPHGEVRDRESKNGDFGRHSSIKLLDDKSETSKWRWIPQLVSMFSGLKTATRDSSADLFVKSYTFTGIISLHNDSVQLPSVDVLGRNNTQNGRIATALFYLSNVKKGGETVFPVPGVVVTPEAGSALFWFASYSDGSTDPAMAHASCPILIGSKWIMNKWILYDGQFPNWKCAKQPGQRYRVRVNGKT